MAYKTVWLCILQLHKCTPVRFILFSVSSTQVYGLSLIAGLDCGLDRWTGLWTGSVDWIVDWIGGLDCWSGLLDPTKLPVKAMMHV